MRLLNRLGDILSANLNELVERYEDPELLLKQAVREMDESIRAALQSAVKVVAHEKVLARQLADEEAAAGRWRRRAEAAVAQGDDEAAREALRRQRERDVVAASLAGQLDEATRAGQLLRRQIEAMRLRSQEAGRKLVLLSARQRAAEARQRLLREFSAAPVGDDAFQKFERMCRKAEQSEAEADALAEFAHYGSEAGEFVAGDMFPNEADDDAEIETELAALKARCGV